MNKIIRSLFVVTAVAFMAIGSSGAYFSDSVTVGPNQFSTGTWETGQGRMVINEVYFDGNVAWIELYNAGAEVADIKGWSVCNGLGSCGKLNPDKKTDVPSHGFVLVSHDTKDLKDLNIPDSTPRINYSGGSIDFNTSGDSVKLFDKDEKLIDEMSYSNGLLPISLERKTPGLDTNSSSDFTSHVTPTPGA